jgi:hypothetical protein
MNILRPAGVGFCFSIFLLFCSQIGLAADGDRISITPRVWFTNLPTNFYEETPNASGAGSQSVIQVPLQGATITYAPKESPGIDFLITGLYGTGTANFVDGNTFGNTDLSRLDIEFLIRKDIKNTTIKAMAGVRYINYVLDDKLTSAADVHSSTGTRSSISDIELFLGEFGLSGFNNITPNGKHRMFWNAMGGLGYGDFDRPNRLEVEKRDARESIIWSFDINIGYAYTINKNFGLNARYRSFGTPSDIADTDHEEVALIHGPEFGVTYNF